MTIENKLKNLKKEIFNLAVPSEEEKVKIQNIAKDVQEKIEDLLKNYVEEVKICGSVGKDTWIKGKKEIDIFPRFNKNLSEKEIQELLINNLKKEFKIDILHGTRDYCRFFYEGFTIEVVPVYYLESPKEYRNIMDVSPFHVDYVNKKLNKEQKDNVRILKYFLKLINCYGAESHINGFSGYTCELLIINFKTFENTIGYLLSNKPKIIIDIEKYYKNYKEIKKTLGESKIDSPIIIIDPVLKERNACSALNNHTYQRFLRNTLIKLNILPEPNFVKSLRIVFEVDNEKNDKVILSQLFSLTKKLANNLKFYKFIVYDYFVYKKNNNYISELQYINIDLNKILIKEGPHLWQINQIEKFINKNYDKIIGYVVENFKLNLFIEKETTDIKYYTNRILKTILQDLKLSNKIKGWEIV